MLDGLNFLLFSRSWFDFHSVFWNNFFLPKTKIIWCLFRNLNFSPKFTPIEVFFIENESLYGKVVCQNTGMCRQGGFSKYRDVQTIFSFQQCLFFAAAEFVMITHWQEKCFFYLATVV